VGGGPVGLATALTLSNPPHSYNVIVLEQMLEQSGVKKYDPTKAYLYLINQRGQVWTKRFPTVQSRLEERGSKVYAGIGNFVIVPGNPQVPIPNATDVSASADTKGGGSPEVSYWVPRHVMVDLLEDAIQEQEKSRTGETIGSIQILPGNKFQSMEPTSDDLVEVTVMDTRDDDKRYECKYKASLVVGADGMNSGVREFLGDDVTKPLKANWLSMNPKKFQVHKWTSPASGLRMKVLQFPPGFSIPDSDGSMKKTENEIMYAIRSVNKGPLNYISLGLLPVKDPSMIRPTNVIARPNHEIWKLKDGNAIKEWFTKAFPRLRMNELVAQEEWDRFAQAKGTTFPKCQYCGGMSMTSPDGTAGVTLVGDAIHAFPPDIGQGINAGLSDVEALDRALLGKDIVSGEFKDSAKPLPALGDALQEYERNRIPEVKALIRLARFGSPYQYRQPLYKDRVGRFLWSMNVLFRLLLNKVSFGLIPKAAIMMTSDKSLTYRQVMRRADMTTVGLVSALAIACIYGIFSRLGGQLAMGSGSLLALLK
jgi:kynurenine 3-monooxygenase